MRRYGLATSSGRRRTAAGTSGGQVGGVAQRGTRTTSSGAAAGSSRRRLTCSSRRRCARARPCRRRPGRADSSLTAGARARVRRPTAAASSQLVPRRGAGRGCVSASRMPSEIASGLDGIEVGRVLARELAQGRDVGARHAAARGQRLRDRQSEPLPEARQDERLGMRVEIAQLGVVDPAERDDALGRADAHIAPAVGADQRQAHAPSGAPHERERLEQRGQVLARLGRADAEQVRRLERRRARTGSRRPARSRSGSRAACGTARPAGPRRRARSRARRRSRDRRCARHAASAPGRRCGSRPGTRRARAARRGRAP